MSLRKDVLVGGLVALLGALVAVPASGPTIYVGERYSLAQAVADAGTEPATLAISSEQFVRRSVTVPANIRLRFIRGGAVTVPAGASLTINGPLDGELREIFKGTGSVSLFTSPERATPQMFGAKGDGQTDDTVSVQKAIDSSDNVFFPDGTYVLGKITPSLGYLANTLLKLHSNLSVSGNGKKSILKVRDHTLDATKDTASNANVMVGIDLENVSISKLAFDLNGRNNLTPPGQVRTEYAVYVLGGSNLTVRDNYFYDSAGRNVILLQDHGPKKASGAVVAGNTLKNGGYYVGASSGQPAENVNNTDFSFMYSTWNDSVIEKNWIEEEDTDSSLKSWAGGIELHGSNQRAEGNTLIGTNPGIYVFSVPGALETVIVTGNKIRKSSRGIVIGVVEGSIKNLSMTNNDIELTVSRYKQPPGGCVGISMPVADVFTKTNGNAGYIERVNVEDNRIVNDFSGKPLYPCDGMELHSLHGATIRHNNISGMTGTGIVFRGSPWGSQDVEISSNTVVNCGQAKPDALKAAIFLSQSGSAKEPALPFHAENIKIVSNILGNTDSKSYEVSGITFAGLDKAKLRGLLISGNKFEGVRMRLSDGRKEIGKLETLNPEAHSDQQ